MAPPPSTPAPKFLFHRPQPQHHQQGASQAHSSPRFVTPRFTTAAQAAPPSSSTPKPSQLFVQSGTRPRHREEIESSPPSSPVLSRAVPETDDERGLGGSEEDESGGDGNGLRERERKRRRISISPDVDDDDDGRIEPEELREDSQSLVSATEDDDDEHEDENIAESPLEERSSRASSLDLTQEDRFPPTAAHQQPTFQQPPRFRIPSVGAHAQAEALPPAFSPQRKGSRYVPGGLAAEMQGWLSHIKGTRGEAAEGVLRFVVGEVREGGRMYLVRGRRPGSDNGGEGPGSSLEEIKVLLAGEGELTGLGPRAHVKEGCVVVAGGLRWDIELDGLGKWTVVCDWKVVGAERVSGE